MDHLAIDIGGRESQICSRAASGEIKLEKRVSTAQLPRLFQQVEPCRVVLEACAESFWLADAARSAGHEIRVISTTLVRALGVGSRKTKNDRKDARVISEASCRIDLPSVHIPSLESRDRKSMLSARDSLVSSRTMMINVVRGWMRTRAIRLRRSGEIVSFPERVREACSELPLPSYVDRTLNTITTLTAEIVSADRELRALAKKDTCCPRLMSVPGVGPTTAIAFKATLDVVERFHDAHHVQAYLGLTPGEYASSDKLQRTGITKAGCTRMRWLLVQAAWTAKRTAPKDPMVLWATEVEKRRGKKVAIVALARKLAGILFAIWRDGTLYSARDAAAPQQVCAPAAE
jgi:transposase